MSSRAAAIAALLAAALLATSACGKKGDPEPPLLPIPQAASDLTVEQRGDRLILRFAYPRTTAAGLPLPGLDRVEIFELARPAVRPLPPADTADPETEAAESEAAESEATESEAAETAAGTTEAARTEPSGTAWIAPVVDGREFTAAATLRTTLRGDELTAAVRGDRFVVELPAPASAGAPPAPDEPPAVHFFAVRSASEGDYLSAFSNRPAILPLAPPPAPRGLELTPKAEGIAVAWQAVATDEPTGYNVYRRLATERDFAAPLEPLRSAATGYLDRRASYGERYIYAVTSVLSRRPLIESAIAQTSEIHYRDTFPPPSPTGLVALADDSGIRLLWNESEAEDLAGYRLYRRTGDGPWRPLADDAIAELDFADTSAQPGVRYGYRVTAVDNAGNESDAGEEAETSIPLAAPREPPEPPEPAEPAEPAAPPAAGTG